MAGWDEEAVAPPEEEKEAQRPRVKRSVRAPTKEEREWHEVTHLPFKKWCKVCVKARGRSAAHAKVEHDDEVSTIHIDYWFVTKRKQKVRWDDG